MQNFSFLTCLEVAEKFVVVMVAGWGGGGGGPDQFLGFSQAEQNCS